MFGLGMRWCGLILKGDGSWSRPPGWLGGIEVAVTPEEPLRATATPSRNTVSSTYGLANTEHIAQGRNANPRECSARRFAHGGKSLGSSI